MATSPELQPAAAQDDLRSRNRRVVEDYMSRRGEGRLTRYLLFTQDGSGGLWTNDTGMPIISKGHDGLKAHGVWSLQCFPDWEWKNIQIYETQDPNRFWVECDGEGKILFPGYPPGYYANHFIHSFLMEDGKIKQNREFMNPYEQMKALGIPIPGIKREGLPQ
ncbi:PhzA/PhzB family protein [Dyella sp. GSA-30]|uniref:PhzA/PhzB family protein n=1 Tax=Dyella sp. GSA-30 TaxID=2994496 RepID=UPI00249255EF|nr:PhzA/PhzB family protein [Dyella sp. GSA-30]BDU21153.1 phenazine biosynthesis protein PhzB 1 [Dyella sp. GSA-30]